MLLRGASRNKVRSQAAEELHSTRITRAKAWLSSCARDLCWTPHASTAFTDGYQYGALLHQK